MADTHHYATLCAAIAGEALPAALVDLDAFDRNIERLLAPVRAAKKTLRVASKSVRCPDLLRRIAERGGEAVRGLMVYSAREAAFLAAQGFDDLLLAYPCAHPVDIAHVVAANERGRCAVVIDSEEQLALLAEAGVAHGIEIPVVVELDMSYRPLGRALHIGVRRSPVRSAAQVVALARRADDGAGLRFGGVMAYEAQIAGLTDDNPFARALDWPKRLLKQLSRRDVEARRTAVRDALARAGLDCALYNGGGTGSLAWCSGESALTEVTAGSGFLCSHLFDYYHQGLALEPAALFALQVVRRPAPNVVTCHGGGYVASGEAGRDRLPVPYLPRGLTLFDLEGAGEVQTPMRLPDGVFLALGDPVFMRHAKAGELAEHFGAYLLYQGGRIVGRAPTYRGLGQTFL
ncbi:MAG: alanine racemase [Myxococcales bacterium]|nr:alanine racemase [Myxococcales bacterium]